MFSGAELFAIILGVVALVVAVLVFVSFTAVRRRIVTIQRRGQEETILEAVAEQIEEVRALRGDIRRLGADVQALSDAFRGTIQRFAVYRFDAFEDMGGQLSFAAALLNDYGDGLVISCINGRREARTYAKPVAKAQSAYNLSPEEQEAIRLALAGTPGT